MTHLIKLCVGIKSVSQLEEYRRNSRERGDGRKDGMDVHRTRMMPKRGDEIAGKGSLYWVITGKIQVRQLIVALERTTDEDGKKYCDIIMDPKLIRTIPQPKRAFQGWRYLACDDAPPDMDLSSEENDSGLAAELTQLGLL